jgi:hypothetical protein
MLSPEITAGVDLVFVARGATVDSTMPKVEKAMRELLRQAGILS